MGVEAGKMVNRGGRGIKRKDGLNPNSRAARLKNGKYSATIYMDVDTRDRLKKFCDDTGLSMGGAIKFLIDNRPELNLDDFMEHITKACGG
jgi:hypothetical protein